MKTIRQNFLLPMATKRLLNDQVPKGYQSRFVAQAIEEKIRCEKSWNVLSAPVLLNAASPVKLAKKMRQGWQTK